MTATKQETKNSRQKSKVPLKSSFPMSLFDMLEDSEKKGFDHIVSWLPGGTAFKIHNIKEFTESIMPIYFRHQTRYKSFSRQLNLYKFKYIKDAKCSQSRDADNVGGFFHPLFVRGNKTDCRSISREKKPQTQTNSRQDLSTSIAIQQKAVEANATAAEPTIQYYYEDDGSPCGGKTNSFSIKTKEISSIDTTTAAGDCIPMSISFPVEEDPMMFNTSDPFAVSGEEETIETQEIHSGFSLYHPRHQEHREKKSSEKEAPHIETEGWVFPFSYDEQQETIISSFSCTTTPPKANYNEENRKEILDKKEITMEPDGFGYTKDLVSNRICNNMISFQDINTISKRVWKQEKEDYSGSPNGNCLKRRSSVLTWYEEHDRYLLEYAKEASLFFLTNLD